MDRKKLLKIKDELDAMRRSSVTAAEVQSLARRLGRRLSTRGKHPNWVSDEFDDLYPLSIPDHGGGRDLSPGVKKVVLNNLEWDVMAWEERIAQSEKSSGNGAKG